MFKVPAKRLRDYVGNPDPLAEAANTVAMVIACNQPFYPFYLYFAVGGASWPSWLTLLSTPFFVAVPVVARRSSLAGRTMLALLSIAATMLAVKALGAASYVQLFLLPCVALGALLFRPGERAVMALVFLSAILAYLSLANPFLDVGLGVGIATLSPGDEGAIAAVNAMSVVCLTAVIGIVFYPLLTKGSRQPPQ